MRHRTLLTLLVVSSCCLAEDFTIKVDEGSFALSGVTLKTGRFPRLTGKATNNTDRNWRSVAFRLIVYDASGKTIPIKTTHDSDVGCFVVTTGSFKPGETKRLELGILDAEALKKVEMGRFDVQFKTGIYPAQYTLTMTKPQNSDDLHFQDESIDASFSFPKEQIAFVLKNKTNNPITIKWDQVAYVDFFGTSHKVLHKGIRLIDREQPQSPTLIPPNAQIDDLVVPTDYVAFVGGNWKHENILPDNVVAKLLKGKTISVFMPLEVNGSTKNYSFEFLVTDVR